MHYYQSWIFPHLWFFVGLNDCIIFIHKLCLQAVPVSMVIEFSEAAVCTSVYSRLFWPEAWAYMAWYLRTITTNILCWLYLRLAECAMKEWFNDSSEQWSSTEQSWYWHCMYILVWSIPMLVRHPTIVINLWLRMNVIISWLLLLSLLLPTAANIQVVKN